MKKLFLIVALLIGISAFAVSLDSFKDIGMLKNVKAQSWRADGKNFIVSGNVIVVYENWELHADRAVINPDLQDIEASGNIELIHWQKSSTDVTPEKLYALEQEKNIKVQVKNVSGDIWGDRSITVEIRFPGERLKVDRLVGNLKSGYFRFDKAAITIPELACRADSGERRPDGVIVLKNGEISSCAYLGSNNAHYSVGATQITLTPFRQEFYGVENIEKSIGSYSVELRNGVLRCYGLPVFYLPYFYKPKDESPGLFGIKVGKSGDLGYFVKFSKKYTFSEYPESYVRLHADYYNLRGFGYGAEGGFSTEQSKTEFMAYSIYDLRPSENNDYDKYRIKVPHGRFDFRISNVTHLTPRLDFRGAFEYVSDPYFRRDFFNSRFAQDAEPATFLALEQQFDHFSASLYFRMQAVKSFTTVEKIPEFQLLGHRQQILNTPFYYRGDMTMGYYQMKWIDFDYPVAKNLKDNGLNNYESFRLDTTHFLYLPLQNRYFSLIPRAGIKMTTYSRSSDEKVTDDDLNDMISAANPQAKYGYEGKHYDSDGGSRVRWATELGAELSTKIHNTWKDVRSPLLQLDGLRHVLRPYINYTYINNPTVSKENLYYFDDIDRIERQNFFRFGLENRLQTRSGNEMREYLRLENFLDLYPRPSQGSNALGSFCTILSMTPVKGFTLSTHLMIDTGRTNEELPSVIRNGRDAGHPGLNVDWINRWNVQLEYTPIEDWKFTFSYEFARPYSTYTAYSMGSTLTQLESSRWFNKYYTDYSELLSFAADFPLTPDRRTFGGFSVSYDFQKGHIENYSFKIKRLFHCIEVASVLSFDYDQDCGSNWDTSFSIQATLPGLNHPAMQGTNSVLASSERNESSLMGF